VHVVSAFVGGEVADVFGVPAERIHVVPNGVAPRAPGDPAAGRRQARNDRYVLAIATIEPRKNLATLVRAFDAVAADEPDLALVIAGARGWDTHEFDAALAGARAADRIVVAGRVSDVERADLLAGATLLAYPSRYEGFGLPPLEAMCCGCPVIAADAASIPEVCGDAALYFDPASPADLAGKLAALMASEAERRALALRGRARAARFSWREAALANWDALALAAGARPLAAAG
jgi:glycosyltransferase involved in cell wall biosynthesis